MSLFPEEQLDSSAGYFAAQPGQSLKNGRLTIVRKLGWGPRSSTWLALSKDRDCFEAIKILTVEATEDGTGNNEKMFLLGPVKNIQDGVSRLVHYFFEHDAKCKRHLCLAFHTLGFSVESVRLRNIYHGKYLQLHVVQKVIGDVAESLSELANQKVVHGAVTADNFLFWSIQTANDIRKELAKSPSERATWVTGSDGALYPVVKSQPMPQGFRWNSSAEDIMHASIYLTSFAHARYGGKSVKMDASPNYLPPEALRGERVDPKSDIWMLGCTAYLLLTGKPLFSDSYVASPVKTVMETVSKLESLLAESEKIEEKDIPAAAAFLRSCLAIKPNDRASAVDVLNGGWIRAGCSCGWCGF